MTLGNWNDWSHNSPVTALYNGRHCVAVHSVHPHMLHISIAQNATARTKSWTELRCIAILQLHSIADQCAALVYNSYCNISFNITVAILQLHSIEDQCASILVDLEKAVRRPAPGALLECGGSVAVVSVWQCGSVPVWQCGANVGNLTVRLPTPDGQHRHTLP